MCHDCLILFEQILVTLKVRMEDIKCTRAKTKVERPVLL